MNTITRRQLRQMINESLYGQYGGQGIQTYAANSGNIGPFKYNIDERPGNHQSQKTITISIEGPEGFYHVTEEMTGYVDSLESFKRDLANSDVTISGGRLIGFLPRSPEGWKMRKVLQDVIDTAEANQAQRY